MPRTVICLGAGPSLTRDDVVLCARHFLIAVNSSYKLAPFADVLYAADYQWWDRHSGCPDFDGLKFGMNVQWGERYRNDVALLEPGPATGLSLDPHRLALGKNSGYQAINLAVHFGAETIILLGYDMQPSHDGRHHWHEPHPGDRHPGYRRCLDAFATLKEPLTQLGVTVLNASRVSAIPDSIFPRVSLPEVLDAQSFDHHPLRSYA